LILVLTIVNSHAQTDSAGEIRIAIPHRVIINMINAALPFPLDRGSYLKGSLWIQAIDNLNIGTNQVTADLDIRGKNIKLETHLGNQVLSMDIGNFNTKLGCSATVQYDASRRILHITPHILQKPDKNRENKMVDSLLQVLPLINGVDYPIEIQKFQPLMTQISGEQFQIDLEITRLYTEKDTVFIGGQPKFQKIPPLPPQ
jgi:hypothetical protein